MQINNQYVPVEIKLHDFDLKALNQLSRYMNVYNCAYGIASAERLAVELPSNITFVSFKDLEKGIKGQAMKILLLTFLFTLLMTHKYPRRNTSGRDNRSLEYQPIPYAILHKPL